nr:ROK family protein [Petrotoga sp. 9PWA.NaAc.5.4]
MKNKNQFEILKYIFENKKALRTEISKDLGLSGPTISRSLSSYIDKKVLRITGKKKSKTGRRSDIIEFSDFYKILGIQIDKNFIKFGIFGLNQTVFDFVKYEIDTSNFEVLINFFRDQMIKISDMEIVATIIGFPGYIFDEEVISSSITNWKCEYSDGIVNLISSYFPNSIIKFENDANLLAIREKFLEKGRKNIICVYWGHGIGMGLVINGELYVGEGMAGELGQVTFYRNILEDHLRNLKHKDLVEEWIYILDSLKFIFHPQKIVLNSPFNDIFEEVVEVYKKKYSECSGINDVEIEISTNEERAIVEGAVILGTELFLKRITKFA